MYVWRRLFVSCSVFYPLSLIAVAVTSCCVGLSLRSRDYQTGSGSGRYETVTSSKRQQQQRVGSGDDEDDAAAAQLCQVNCDSSSTLDRASTRRTRVPPVPPSVPSVTPSVPQARPIGPPVPRAVTPVTPCVPPALPSVPPVTPGVPSVSRVPPVPRVLVSVGYPSYWYSLPCKLLQYLQSIWYIHYIEYLQCLRSFGYSQHFGYLQSLGYPVHPWTLFVRGLP